MLVLQSKLVTESMGSYERLGLTPESLALALPSELSLLPVLMP
jgi:hypothetical protein